MPPLVSIVIAVRNGAATLSRCLDSVHVQTWPHEIVAIDGGSRDGSDRILEADATRLAYWHSRPDRGICHAWNQALEHVTGDWLLFLGADDYFIAGNSLARLAEADDGATDLISGRSALVDARGRVRRIVPQARGWDHLVRAGVLAHGAMLHRATLFSGGARFDEELRLAGDYGFLLSLGRDLRVRAVDDVVVAVGDRGVSHTNVPRVIAEVYRIRSRHPKVGPARARWQWMVAWARHLVRPMAVALTLGRFRAATGRPLAPPAPPR